MSMDRHGRDPLVACPSRCASDRAEVSLSNHLASAILRQTMGTSLAPFQPHDPGTTCGAAVPYNQKIKAGRCSPDVHLCQLGSFKVHVDPRPSDCCPTLSTTGDQGGRILGSCGATRPGSSPGVRMGVGGKHLGGRRAGPPCPTGLPIVRLVVSFARGSARSTPLIASRSGTVRSHQGYRLGLARGAAGAFPDGFRARERPTITERSLRQSRGDPLPCVYGS